MRLLQLKRLSGLFGLVLVLSMMLFYVQNRLKKPGLSRINSLIQETQRQVVASRRDPQRIFCRTSSASSQEPNVIQSDGKQSLQQNGSGNGSTKDMNNNIFQKQEEIQNIVFINGHRAGEDTVQPILLRFAMTRNLNVLLPLNDSSFMNETGYQINRTQILKPSLGQKYNILCHRIIFNKEVLMQFFPTSTVFVGILRHPLYQSASALYYYAHRQQRSKYSLTIKESPKNPYRAFINQPDTYDVEPPNQSFTNNRQSIDLGFPITVSFKEDKIDNTLISKFIEKLDRTFNMVIITEMFDESLILLRHVLHWNMEDILYTRLRVDHDEETNYLSDIEGLSEQDKEEHRKWASLDYAVYGHFRSKLEGIIISKGEEFQLELQKFREIQEKVKNFCGMIKNSFRSLELRIKPSNWSSGFCITPRFCDIIKKDGVEMTELMKSQQIENMNIASLV